MEKVLTKLKINENYQPVASNEDRRFFCVINNVFSVYLKYYRECVFNPKRSELNIPSVFYLSEKRSIMTFRHGISSRLINNHFSQ